MKGYLRQRGIRVQRRKIRQSLHRVDPAGTELRRLGLRWINRRRYRAKGPNDVWHIDGHHKLIRCVK